ncbi:hypothetical protein R5W24_002582 [Gemmata sp. JC717]|uniref:hypothetical protein n=1 Tax=Gemmata algarum TaxID=2975278 RepID=UPI0021BA8EC0|nr:hypothetical protein [Gemmata algarum]MDY3553480.1 hypothetical protein [Gemmata algarum]
MWNPPPEHPLRRLFAGLAEHAFFSHLGVADPPLTDYLSSLLTRFIHNDAVFRLRGDGGQPLTELTDMVVEAARLPAGGRTQCDYYRHIGDFALFWTGVYPEAVERMRSRACKDAFVNYTAQGKRGYMLTSRLEEERHHDEEAGLFRRLSDQFEVCALGLRKVREEWEEMRSAPPGGGVIG